ncbi:hypothetical protein BDR06DRAFT_965115 [Suillus hirtellus]|nr:hypothetical protein BDR06DRAFT_965115 [Suillus hirtellus]
MDDRDGTTLCWQTFDNMSIERPRGQQTKAPRLGVDYRISLSIHGRETGQPSEQTERQP